MDNQKEAGMWRLMRFVIFVSSVNQNTPVYSEPKFIVFYSMLLSLFSVHCFNCKLGNPAVDMKTYGTMVIVQQSCKNCRGFKWYSQPYVLGRFPAGNILLSFSSLMAGMSISRVLLMFYHMGMSVYSKRTYFSHQKKIIFPMVLKYWYDYRMRIITQLQRMKNVVWCGDGRFDSMGHSAKYGVYTMFSTTIMKIVHFELVQVSYIEQKGTDTNFALQWN